MRSVSVILSFMLISAVSCTKTGPAPDGQYFTVTADKLMVRDRPEVSGKATGSMVQGEKVLLVSRTGKKEVLNGRDGEWFRVKTKANVTGFAFSGFLVPFVEYEKNSRPFDITGEWHMYMDPPNTSFYFYRDKTCKVESIAGYDSKTVTVKGTYRYDGTSVLELRLNDGKIYNFQVVKAGGRTTLKLGYFFFDAENLHRPLR